MTMRSPFAVVAAVALLAACGDGPSEPQGPPTFDEVVGAYEAVELIATTDDETTDALADGFEVELELRGDGSTVGTLVIPEDGGLSFDLTGTWSFDEATSRVELDHEADTFLRDMVFDASRAGGAIELSDERYFASSDTRVQVVLRKDPTASG